MRRSRVILLGASNVALGFPIAVRVCHQFYGQPLDIFSAHGHGRGYGLESWVLGRWLPSILECGIWEGLAAEPQTAAISVLTDIGNDLVFGASPMQVADWVEQCLQRLSGMSEQVILTELPLVSLMQLSPLRFRVLRTLFFPRSILTPGVAADHVRQLNEYVIELADRYAARLVRPQADWYGFDPIHIRRAWRWEAWRKNLAGSETPSDSGSTTFSFAQARSLCCLRPQHRRLFGVTQLQKQPCTTLPNGTSIWLY